MHKTLKKATAKSASKSTLTTSKRNIARNPNQTKTAKFTDVPLKKSSPKAPTNPSSKLMGPTLTTPTKSTPSSVAEPIDPNSPRPRSKYAMPQKVVEPAQNSSPPPKSAPKSTPKSAPKSKTKVHIPDIHSDDSSPSPVRSIQRESPRYDMGVGDEEDNGIFIMDTAQKLKNEIVYGNPVFTPIVDDLTSTTGSARGNKNIDPRQEIIAKMDYAKINDQQTRLINSVRVSTLKNGVKIITAADSHSPFTSISLSVDMGPQYEDTEPPLPRAGENIPPPKFKGITGAYAHMLNNILQNPNSDVEFKEERRQRRKRDQLLKEMIKRTGGKEKLTQEMFDSVMTATFPTKAEKEASKAAVSESLLESEFARFTDPVVSPTASTALPSTLKDQASGKKTWRQQLRDGALPHTKWFVEPHKEHLTISAYTTDDKLVKILKMLSMVLIHPDFNEEDYKLCMYNLSDYWDFKLGELNQAIAEGIEVEQITDFEALTTTNQHILSKASFHKNSSLRGPYQPLDSIMKHYDHIDINKWHRLFFHPQNDKNFTTQHPLTLSITGVNSDADHQNIVTMCEQFLGGFNTRDEPFVKVKSQTAHTPVHKMKTGAFISSQISAIAQGTSGVKDDSGSLDPSTLLALASLITPLDERRKTHDKFNHFSPSVWESESVAPNFHQRFQGRMPTMALTWEDTSNMSLLQYATQSLLNKTTFAARLHKKKEQQQIQKTKQEQSKTNPDQTAQPPPTTSAAKPQPPLNSPCPGAYLETTFKPRNAGFTHTPIHSTVIKNLFDTFAPQLGIGSESHGLSQDVLAAALPKFPRIIFPNSTPLNNTGIFSLIMTLNRSKHSFSIRNTLMKTEVPQISKHITEARLEHAKKLTIAELLQSQHLFPSSLPSTHEQDHNTDNATTNNFNAHRAHLPTMGSYPTDPANNGTSFFGGEVLRYAKDLARQAQLFNTYITPAMIKKVQEITLDEIKDVADNIFKGSTRHDPPKIQALPPPHPGLALLGVRNDSYITDMLLTEMKKDGMKESEIDRVIERAQQKIDLANVKSEMAAMEKYDENQKKILTQMLFEERHKSLQNPGQD